MPTAKPPSESGAKRRSHFNNWISAIGGVVAVGAMFSFALLVWMDFSQGEKNPYLGILTYVVAPIFLVAGLMMVLTGAWMQRRYALKHAGNRPDRWQLDFGDIKQRRFIFTFAGAG